MEGSDGKIFGSRSGLACVAGVRRGKKEERRAREAREDRTRDASPSRAHFDFLPFLRPAMQARSGRTDRAQRGSYVLTESILCASSFARSVKVAYYSFSET